VPTRGVSPVRIGIDPSRVSGDEGVFHRRFDRPTSFRPRVQIAWGERGWSHVAFWPCLLLALMAPLLLALALSAEGPTPCVTLHGHRGPPRELLSSPDGHSLYTLCDNTVATWNLDSGRAWSRPAGEEGPCRWLRSAFSRNGSTPAVQGYDGIVTIYDTTNERGRALFSDGSRSLMKLTLSPDGLFLAASFDPGGVWLWETATGREVFGHRFVESRLMCVAFSPDGRALAIGSEASVRLWTVGEPPSPDR
jgi:WD40 repeat protein